MNKNRTKVSKNNHNNKKIIIFALLVNLLPQNLSSGQVFLLARFLFFTS